MGKRGGVLAFGVFLVLLSSALAVITSSQPAAAFPLCFSDSNCNEGQECYWGFCVSLPCETCDAIKAAQPDPCSSDSDCAPGGYCGEGSTLEVAVGHSCGYLSNSCDRNCQSCSYPSADCDFNGGCETNLDTSTSNCGSCGNTCASGWSCESGKCKAQPRPVCNDGDWDQYYSNAVVCGAGASKQDCDDADKGKWQLLSGYVDADGDGYTVGSAVSVCSGGSLPSGYVLSSSGADCDDKDSGVWKKNTCGVCAKEPGGFGNSCTVGVGACQKTGKYECDAAGTGTKCGATAGSPSTEVCGNGVDEDCSGSDKACTDVCGDYKVTGSEVCDWGSGSVWGNGVWAPKWVDCAAGYDRAYGEYTCRADCSGYEYDTGSCGRCGDGVVNGLEECDGQKQVGCVDALGNAGKKDCSSLTCKWLECVKTVVEPKCTDGVKNGGETGVDCGGSCVGGSEVCGDGLDNDRDCVVDEGCVIPCAPPLPLCTKQQGVCSGSSKCTGACDSADYLNHNPSYEAAETKCDSLDNDCDGSVDEGCDDDGDEFCDSSMSWSGTVLSSTCAVASAGDCNDANANINPGAVDVCGNGVDEDCSWGDAACLAPGACDGVEKDSSQSCCVAAGFQWVKSGEANVGRDEVDNQFKDSRGVRRAPVSVKLLPNEYRCIGDDADEQFFVRTRDCKAGVCASSAADKSLCDKASDCVYAGKCYSDLKLVAATFFNSGLAAAWGSSWKGEVSVDVGSDGKLEFCDPGEWQGPVGSVAGTVTDSVTGLGISAAVVVAVGTSNPALTYTNTTGAGGAYVIGGLEPANYDVTASKADYDSQSVNNQPVLPFQTTTVDFALVPGGGGVWGQGSATVTGAVRNVSTENGDGPCPAGGCPVAGALVKVLGTSPLLAATTAADGSYSISNVPSGVYDLVASRLVDGYEDGADYGNELSSGTVTVDFTLLRARGGCEDDCTKVGSNLCDASCQGKGMCWFYSQQAMDACDGTFGIVDVPGGKSVECCKGRPYAPVKADVTVRAKQVVKTVKPVLYKGKLVKLITLLFIPEK